MHESDIYGDNIHGNYEIYSKKLYILYKNALLKRAHNMFSTDKLIVKNC